MSRISSRRGKTHYSEALKQQLVDAANQPGVSLSKIAQQWGVSVSALSKWRQQSQKLLPAAPTLIPIAIQATEETSADIKAPVDKSAYKSPGIIEVILQRARIQICGWVDTELLRAVLKVCQDD